MTFRKGVPTPALVCLELTPLLNAAGKLSTPAWRFNENPAIPAPWPFGRGNRPG
jgi:hypothetical protein